MTADFDVRKWIPDDLTQDESAIRAEIHERVKYSFFQEIIPQMLKGKEDTDTHIDMIHMRIRANVSPLISVEHIYIPGGFVPSWNWQGVGLLGAIGAVLGGWVIQSLLGFLFAFPQAGYILGAPLGAFLLIFGLAKLSGHPRLVKTLQFVLGAATAGFTIAGVFSLLRGRWFGHRGPTPVQWFGLAFLSLLLILLIRIYRPVRKKDPQQIKEALEIQLQSLLTHAVAVIEATTHDSPKGQPITKPKLLCEEGLAQSLHTIHQAVHINHQEMALDGCTRLIGELESMGVHPRAISGQMTYTKEIDAHFRVFGTIEDGDAIEMLHHAWVDEQGRAVIKGLVRRANR